MSAMTEKGALDLAIAQLQSENKSLLAMLKRVTEEYEATRYFESETIKMAKALIAAKEK